MDLPTGFSLLDFLRERPAFRGLLAIHAADELGAQMMNVAVGWYVYSATHNPMSLAYVGLAHFLPKIGILLIAGHAADRLNRQKLIKACLLIQAISLAGFSALLATGTPRLGYLYLLMLMMGSASAFAAPAKSAMMPAAVSGKEFPRAVAINSSVFQVCSIGGPALGGVLYLLGAPLLFAILTAICLFAVVATGGLTAAGDVDHAGPAEAKPEGILAGVRYLGANRLLLSLISLDLFAVLLGGVSALLPIYAKDILIVGPVGLGCLRCAPGVGAAIVGFGLAERPMKRRAGKLMLFCVGGFGLATMVFALSKSFLLSLGALAMAGGFDMVSMVIRQTLVQISTPDGMRGRVSAVNWAFVSASSELGEFESGITAAWFGTIPAALVGGVGTLVVAALWSTMFPELNEAETPTMATTAEASVST